MNEIVIKISDELLSFVYRNGFVPSEKRDELNRAILECVELPKGHGRLIDADELFDKIQFADFSSSDDVNTALFSISDAPTIIEADKENENDV